MEDGKANGVMQIRIAPFLLIRNFNLIDTNRLSILKRKKEGINAGSLISIKRIQTLFQLTKLILESIGPYADHKNISLSFSFFPTQLVIGIDEEKYERILLNLLSNAIKYTPNGKSVTVKLHRKTVNKKNMACVQVHL